VATIIEVKGYRLTDVATKPGGQALNYNFTKLGNDLEAINTDLSGRLVKVSPAVAGNVPVLTADGSLVDGGIVPGQVNSVVAGTNISVDDTDPVNPVVSATGGAGGFEWDSAALNGTGSMQYVPPSVGAPAYFESEMFALPSNDTRIQVNIFFPVGGGDLGQLFNTVFFKSVLGSPYEAVARGRYKRHRRQSCRCDELGAD
jgi:hypothetical protein